MNVFRLLRAALPRSPFCALVVLVSPLAVFAQPADAPTIGLDAIHTGQTGVVWTVFQGRTAEPFDVEVSGVIRNALGPGKSLILCRLTDPRVQNMGAVAGMSGSPLYIDGKLAGALSYQIQRFETVRYAGFTPIDDLLEVSQLDKDSPHAPTGGAPVLIPLERDSRGKNSTPTATPRSTTDDAFSPLTPRFALGGIAPNVAALFGEQFQALGLSVSAIGGSTPSGPNEDPAAAGEAHQLVPGSAVAVALATGDITLAGTGTVSHVNGNHVLAFGHPLMSLGNVELPMAQADIVAILPSALNSFKISNTGKVIGTIRQDRLSAIYGEIGPGPAMLPIEVKTPSRTLHFQTVRHGRLTPTIAALGLTQAVLGSNDNGLAEGFRVSATVSYPDGQQLATNAVYAGPQGFAAGLDQFVRRLAATLQNPIADVFPLAIAFAVEPLAHNPLANLDLVQLSQTRVHSGEDFSVALTVRDFQGAPVRETISIPVPADWLGRRLELIVTTGAELDRLAGRPEQVGLSQIRTFAAYLDLLRRERHADGLYVAVVERASAFRDQTDATLDYPGSLERISRSADSERFQKRDVLVPLWERHLLSGRLFEANVRRAFQVLE